MHSAHAGLSVQVWVRLPGGRFRVPWDTNSIGAGRGDNRSPVMGDGSLRGETVASASMAYALNAPIPMMVSKSHCTAHHDRSVSGRLTDLVFRGPPSRAWSSRTLLPKWGYESAYVRGTR